MDYSLCCITDRQLSRSGDVLADIRAMCEGGCRLIQLREKELSLEEYTGIARAAFKITRMYGARLIINDSVEVAARSGADGVHLGQKDRGHTTVRELLGDRVLLGVSVSSPAEAEGALQYKPDYLGAGAVFSTPTKPDAEVLGIDGLQSVCELSDVPVLAIGGINTGNLDTVLAAGADGVALVSAIVSAADVTQATRGILSKIHAFHEKS